MASDGVDILRQESWPPVNPWRLVLAGLAASVLALFLSLVQGWMPGEGPARVLVPLRGLAITVGVILAAGAVSVRLRTASWEFEERVVSAALTGLAAFTVLMGWLALDREAWDSIALFLGVVAFVGFAGCVLILLPRNMRRVAALVLIALHFGGILSAVTSAPPPGTAPPWITSVVWTYIYRPYVEFMYVNNAYHFYSPEPGPACQLWFYIKFEDGDGEWLKIPKREDYATRQEYQRMLSVTENARQQLMQQPPNRDFADVMEHRLMAGNAYRPQIKMADGIFRNLQYQEPGPSSKLAIQSYVKHVALTYHSGSHPDSPIKSIKVYRVDHHIVPPGAMAREMDPEDPSSFFPYYQGEFNREGEFIARLGNEDPFLYWLIPIQYELKPGHKPTSATNQADQWNADNYEIVDYCKLHAEGSPN